MSRITAARKVEALASVTVEESGHKLLVSGALDGTGTITVETVSEAAYERAQLRDFIENLVSETPVTEILARLDERDKANEQTYGEHKGEQRPTQTTFWFDRETRRALANVLSEGTIDYDTQTAIDKALNPSTSHW